MNYSIKELSNIAGVSARTLRYYDEIGLLKPLYTTDSGYRYYGEQELDLLQQILFYKERGFDLKRIQKILYQEQFHLMDALEEHLLELKKQQAHIASLIQTVEQTILSMKGEYQMNDTEKFEAFKQRAVQQNEILYGEEARKQYGNHEVDTTNQKIMQMTQQEYEQFHSLESDIKQLLENAVVSGNKPNSEQAKQIVVLHKKWLCMVWKQYTPQAHKGLSAMYVSDERFRTYYDERQPGCAEFLHQAILHWADQC
ncbi:MerR family transcriptional regulator [Massilioclostridium coli]|uniref:MerR family transcriptional regulator n=1 Tax=Massilioclostridium coli TaxID=1870991 RepID=UPI00085C1B07|nr:MerR family transcriptional regulator [Massilioclostridium coli]